MISDVLEIARRLKDAKRLAGHGGWLPWLDREFGWSEDTAERFMSLNRLQGQIPQIAEYDLPVSGLYMLAAPNTPDEARDAVIERAQNGEALSLKDVQRMIQEARDKDAEQREKQREVDAASVRKTIAELKAEAARREEIVRICRQDRRLTGKAGRGNREGDSRRDPAVAGAARQGRKETGSSRSAPERQ
jgi:hypothetical protein